MFNRAVAGRKRKILKSSKRGANRHKQSIRNHTSQQQPWEPDVSRAKYLGGIYHPTKAALGARRQRGKILGRGDLFTPLWTGKCESGVKAFSGTEIHEKLTPSQWVTWGRAPTQHERNVIKEMVASRKQQLQLQRGQQGILSTLKGSSSEWSQRGRPRALDPRGAGERGSRG